MSTQKTGPTVADDLKRASRGSLGRLFRFPSAGEGGFAEESRACPAEPEMRRAPPSACAPPHPPHTTESGRTLSCPARPAQALERAADQTPEELATAPVSAVPCAACHGERREDATREKTPACVEWPCADGYPAEPEACAEESQWDPPVVAREAGLNGRGLLYYQKWWYRRKTDVFVKGCKITGVPVYTYENTLRVVDGAFSYFIPLENVDYIRTTDGLLAGPDPHGPPK